MDDQIVNQVKEIDWNVDYWNVRLVKTASEVLSVRNKVAQPAHNSIDEGFMVSVMHDGGVGYAASSDLSLQGMKNAFEKAKLWAKRSKSQLAFLGSHILRSGEVGEFRTQIGKNYTSIPVRDKLELLKNASSILGEDSRIVDSDASLSFSHVKSHFISNTGADIYQEFSLVFPNMTAVAHDKGQTQIRTLNGHGYARQGGFEIIEGLNLLKVAKKISSEAVELLYAENCPAGAMDLILMPDQMMLQIHESIGHPIELDRILGDERNYAGTSFVTMDMFGSYQYGSPLLNVSFDPGVQGEFASYAFDDEGSSAEKVYVIRNGILEKPLGGFLSQKRASQSGVANSRASNWNRPPIDRMANLNIEPGVSSLKEMVESVEKGVVMHANTSWSIDDSRNKFQFGCEYGQLIENGKLTKTVRNPNYKGISATFWRSLKLVGDASTVGMFGTPFCGKGEPNQAIRVGHASPACLFADVEVFGAES